ncbi:hypothetical protein F4677DRAFT_216519 [Hypoxylon crocopeplum]|nr:hypothetical protein F4677DRAFT_216519 [Hypoxylon crocopeplum]
MSNLPFEPPGNSLYPGIDIQDGHVQITAGELWGSVYEHLEPHGLGVTRDKSTMWYRGPGNARYIRTAQLNIYGVAVPKVTILFVYD